MTNSHAQLAAAFGQAAGHVVAVADIGQRVALQPADQFLQRVQVGQGLAGMGKIGQPVDHRAGAVLRQLDDRLMLIGPHHDHVDILAEHAAEIGHAFARAEADVLAEKQAAAAKLIMPASKLTRVRSDGFSNNSAITRPGRSASRRPWAYLVFRSSVIAKIRSISAVVRSVTHEQMSH